MTTIDINTCADLLRENDNYLILTHANPDGDTLGSAFALHRGLSAAGKKSFVRCGDEIHRKYSYLWSGIDNSELEFDKVIAVDVAASHLLGDEFERLYGDRVFICIDHHLSNKEYAENLLLEDRAATAEIIYELLEAMGISIDKGLANCLYTGIATDTGCFMFTNTSPETHRRAAALMEAGADIGKINRAMFETKSLSYLRLEQMAVSSIETHFGGKCAVMTITQDMFRKSGSSEADCDGIASLPRKIEGVLVGVTMHERRDGSFKVSLRTVEPYDAAKICGKLGGGGHNRAAGCEFNCSLDNAKAILLDAIGAELV